MLRYDSPSGTGELDVVDVDVTRATGRVALGAGRTGASGEELVVLVLVLVLGMASGGSAAVRARLLGVS